jgi:hypothetical protein
MKQSEPPMPTKEEIAAKLREWKANGCPHCKAGYPTIDAAGVIVCGKCGK